jgi:predicted transcriptional regulator of viral defense system
MKKVASAILTEQVPRSPIFTTADAARTAGVSNQGASRSLAGMADAGMITRVRRGLWAITGHPDFSPYAVVPHLVSDDDAAYVSLLSALNLHGMIEQFPRRVQVISTARRPDLETPVGTFEFHRLATPLYGGFAPYGTLRQFDLATPEKALFDLLYLSAQKGRRFVHLPELTTSSDFSTAEVEKWIERIENVLLRQAVRKRWESLAEAIIT